MLMFNITSLIMGCGICAARKESYNIIICNMNTIFFNEIEFVFHLLQLIEKQENMLSNFNITSLIMNNVEFAEQERNLMSSKKMYINIFE